MSLSSFNYLLLKILTGTALLFLLLFAWLLYVKLLNLILDLFPSYFQNVESRIFFLNNISSIFRSNYQFECFKFTVKELTAIESWLVNVALQTVCAWATFKLQLTF